MNEEMIEMIVLMNGNFAPLLMKKSDMAVNESALMQAIRSGKKDEYFFFKLNGVTIFTNAIVGWYFRQKAEAPTDKMIKFLKKELNPNENWKNGEE